MNADPRRSDHEAARLALACLDLTSLNDADTEADVRRLCERAAGPHGAVAAVCVWPRFAALARRLAAPGLRVAAVANFPAGGTDVAAAVSEARGIVDAGADEVDLVLPFGAVLAGDDAAAGAVLDAVRAACPNAMLKVILETGVLADPATIRRAAALALAAGADFLKTSTGKTPVGATPEAVRAMLDAIVATPDAAGRVGLKVSGGVRRVGDARVYLELVEGAFGNAAVGPGRFRFGASGLLDDIERVLGEGDAPPTALTTTY